MAKNREHDEDDDRNVPFDQRDQFPDAEQKTIAWYALGNIRALRRVLDVAKNIPEIQVDALDVWDSVKQLFPNEFTKEHSPIEKEPDRRFVIGRLVHHGLIPKGPPSIGAEVYDYGYTQRAMNLEIPIPGQEAQPTPVGLHCQYCGKQVSSTSGKTLHEKSCKKRPTDDNLRENPV